MLAVWHAAVLQRWQCYAWKLIEQHTTSHVLHRYVTRKKRHRTTMPKLAFLFSFYFFKSSSLCLMALHLPGYVALRCLFFYWKWQTIKNEWTAAVTAIFWHLNGPLVPFVRWHLCCDGWMVNVQAMDVPYSTIWWLLLKQMLRWWKVPLVDGRRYSWQRSRKCRDGTPSSDTLPNGNDLLNRRKSTQHHTTSPQK